MLFVRKPESTLPLLAFSGSFGLRSVASLHRAALRMTLLKYFVFFRVTLRVCLELLFECEAGDQMGCDLDLLFAEFFGGSGCRRGSSQYASVGGHHRDDAPGFTNIYIR